VKQGKIPLGQPTDYPDNYAPELLCPISRKESRDQLGLSGDLPFSGTDIWNAWELTWLTENGPPAAATAEFHVPATSPNIVESKSLKLYLNSFAMSTFASAAEVAERLANDIGACAGSRIVVTILPIVTTESRIVSRLAGACIDSPDVACTQWQVDAGLLRTDPKHVVTEDLYTHLLRSLCPVTAQPDFGSVQLSYRGPEIDRASLLRYIVSYRQHNDFHEACVERIFLDLMAQCRPEKLSVHACYQRRGGIDINPFRSTDPNERPPSLRLWRQ